MPQLVSHSLPDQAPSESAPTHSAGASPAKTRVTGSRQHQAHGINRLADKDLSAGDGAADRGKHKKNLWHRSTDPFAGLLTETLPGKLSLRSSRKKSPDAGSRGT